VRTCLLTKPSVHRTRKLTTSPCRAEVALRHYELLTLRIERSVLHFSRATFGMRDRKRELTPAVATGFDRDSGAAVTTVQSPHQPENRGALDPARVCDPEAQVLVRFGIGQVLGVR